MRLVKAPISRNPCVFAPFRCQCRNSSQAARAFADELPREAFGERPACSHPYPKTSLLDVRHQTPGRSVLCRLGPPPLPISYEPTGGMSRRDKLAIAQCFSIGNALRRINRVPEGRLIWSQVLLTGAGLSRPFGTPILVTGAPQH